MDNEQQTAALMEFSKETLIKMYLQAKEKADLYDKLKQLLDMKVAEATPELEGES